MLTRPTSMAVVLSLTLVLGVWAREACAATYKVGLAEPGYVPFSFPKGDKRKGIFLEILARIGRASGDTFEAVYAPTPRLKALFETGQIDIECGINPAWREDQAEISVYSQPFTSIVDVALRRKARKPASKAAGANLRVGAVRGYQYPRYEDRFAKGEMVRDDADNEQQLLGMLHKGRVDLILIGKVVALYYMKSNKSYRFEIAEQVDSVPVMFRVHKRKKDLLPRLDKALDALLKSGEVETIIDRQE